MSGVGAAVQCFVGKQKAKESLLDPFVRFANLRLTWKFIENGGGQCY